MSDTKLKPCPACLSDELIVYEAHKGGFYVQCENCEMRGPRKDDENAAIDAWNNLSSSLCWTKKTPTKNGWYIYQERRNRKLCCVIDSKATGFAFGLCKVEDLCGEWAGPIPEPQEGPK